MKNKRPIFINNNNSKKLPKKNIIKKKKPPLIVRLHTRTAAWATNRSIQVILVLRTYRDNPLPTNVNPHHHMSNTKLTLLTSLVGTNIMAADLCRTLPVTHLAFRLMDQFHPFLLFPRCRIRRISYHRLLEVFHRSLPTPCPHHVRVGIVQRAFLFETECLSSFPIPKLE